MRCDGDADLAPVADIASVAGGWPGELELLAGDAGCSARQPRQAAGERGMVQSEGGLDERRYVLLRLQRSDAAAEGQRQQSEVRHVGAHVDDKGGHAAFSCRKRSLTQTHFRGSITGQLQTRVRGTAHLLLRRSCCR